MISESQNTIMSFFYHIRLANIKKFDKLFKRYDTNRYSVYCWSEYKFPCRGISDKTAYSFNLWAIISLLEIYSEYTSQIKKYKYTRYMVHIYLNKIQEAGRAFLSTLIVCTRLSHLPTHCKPTRAGTVLIFSPFYPQP